MKRSVTIGGQPVEMVSNAAALIKYKRVFGEDLLAIITSAPNDADASNVFMKLGYIYARTAEGVGLASLSEDDFCAWLEQFEIMDVLESVSEISELYTASTKPTVDPK